MADILHAASSVLFVLSAAFTAVSVTLYIRLDLYGYRQLIRNSRKSRKKLAEKKNRPCTSAPKDTAVREKSSRSGTEETGAPAEAGNREKEKRLPEIFTIRVIKGGGGRKREGAGKTQEQGRAETEGAYDGDAAVLQDGSDDTELLNKDVPSAKKEGQGQDLWMKPARIFRETECVIFIHTDRRVEGNMLK